MKVWLAHSIRYSILLISEMQIEVIHWDTTSYLSGKNSMFDIVCGLGCGEIACHVWPVTMQNVMTSLKENVVMYRKITQAFTLWLGNSTSRNLFQIHTDKIWNYFLCWVVFVRPFRIFLQPSTLCLEKLNLVNCINDQQTFPLNGYRVYVLGFKGYMARIASPKLCCHSKKVSTTIWTHE